MKESTAGSNNRFEIVVVGTSLGGLEALRTLLAGLPSSFGVPWANSEQLTLSFVPDGTRV